MLKAGIIEPSSACASPVVLVPNKDGSLRFCVDYRKVNAYLIPNITEMLESLSGAAIFTTYKKPSSRLGGFRPFGLNNTPATFQMLMEIIQKGLLGTICFSYIDDIIV